MFLQSTDLLRFAVRPDARGRVESALLARGSALAGTQRAIDRCSWSTAATMPRACSALEAAGFKVERDLVTMRRQMRPDDKR